MTQKKKSKSKLTVQEFQTWLEGIMEFQDSDWSPNKEQWVAIYDKIMNLKIDSAGTVNISAQSLRDISDQIEQSVGSLEDNIRNFRHAPVQNAHPPRILEERDPRSLGGESVGAVPAEPQEIISQEELTQLSEEDIRRKIEQAKEYGTSSASSSKPIKTRDIDTSDGNYSSDFI